MKWYFYLNYCIYRFYVNRKDDIPVYSALLVSVTLISLNAVTIRGIYWFIYDFWTIPHMSHSNIKVIAFMSFLGLINYLLLYRKKKYEDVFEEFRRNYDKYKKWNKSVLAYIIITCLLMIIVLVIAVLRNEHVQKYMQ